MVSRIHNRLHLYRSRSFWASGVLLVASLALAAGQFQHKSPHKLRAIALVERTTEAGGVVTTHVIPITILANSSFHDASIYESRPRPMALENGVVYEVQRTGVPVGYVTVTNGSNSLQGWVALGRWQAVKQFQAAPKPKPAATPAETDDRPILHREGESPLPTPTPTPEQPQSTSSDTGRPTLHRSGEESQPAPAPTPEQPQSSPSDTSPGDSDRPVLHRRSDSSGQEPSGSPTPSTNQSASQTQQPAEAEQPAPEDPNRPVLRHRKPGADTADTAPVATKTPPPPTAGPSTIISAAPSTDPGTQVFVGVSDTQSSDTRSYEYHWKPDEETQIQAKMRKLAVAQLPRENAQENEQAMTNVVIRSFDLDLSNDAVVVITAEVPAAVPKPAPPRKTSRLTTSTSSAPTVPAEKPVTRYVTVIARVDIDGNPQKLAASVTDSSRLDVAPRLELIDAVDVNGDGQAELLFREYDFDQKTFIVYGVGHGTVTKVFEGASEPIRPKT